MVKKLVVVMVACLFLVSVTGIVMAAEQAAPAAKAEKPAAAAPEKAPAKHGKEAPKTLSGAVKSVDVAANAIVVEKKGKEISVKVTDKTKFMGAKGLAELSAGDKVTIKYTEKEGQKMAASVKKTTETKKAKPAEHAKPAPAKPAAPAQPMAPVQK